MSNQDSAFPAYSCFGVPPRVRRKPLLPFKEEIIAEEARGALMVTGKHALLFDSDVEAEFTNSPESLLPWNGDRKLMIDRYDVRHLLQDLTGLRHRSARPLSPDATVEELNYERYRDLNDPDDHEMERDENAKRQKTSVVAYQSVKFSYEDASLSQDIATNLDNTMYHPPFAVPHDLEPNLPPSEKVHQIIAGTAKFVSQHGGQSEIVLRVKQSNNPSFAFLMPENRLHAYYRYLVEHPALLGASSHAQQKPAVSIEKSSQGLLMLGDIYGDDDDDEDIARHRTKGADNFKMSLMDGEHGGSSPDNFVNQDKLQFSLNKQHYEHSELHGLSSDTEQYGSASPVSCHSGSAQSQLGCEDQVTTVESGPVTPSEPPPPGTELLKHYPMMNAQDNTLGSSERSLVHQDSPSQTGHSVGQMAECDSSNGKTSAAIVQEQVNLNGLPLPSHEHQFHHVKASKLSQEVKNHKETSKDEESRSVGTGSFVKVMQIEGGVSQKKPAVPLSIPTTRSFNILPVKCKSDLQHAQVDVCGLSVAKTHEAADKKIGFGISSDAAAAVVRAATRGHLQFSLARRGPKEMDGKNRPPVKELEKQQPCGMSLDAAAEAVMEATHGPRKERRVALIREVEHSKSSGALIGKSNVSNDFTETLKCHDSQERSLSNNGHKEKISGLASGDSKPDPIYHESHLLQAHAKVATKAAAAAAALEADSADARLTAEEKRKLERLKRAKLFAAMMQSGVNILEKGELGSDTAAVSMSVNMSDQLAASCNGKASLTDDNTTKAVEALSGPCSIHEGQASKADVSANIVAAPSLREKAEKRRDKHHRHHRKHRHHHRHHRHESIDHRKKSHDKDEESDTSKLEPQVGDEALRHGCSAKDESPMRHVHPHRERKEGKRRIESRAEGSVAGVTECNEEDQLNHNEETESERSSCDRSRTDIADSDRARKQRRRAVKDTCMIEDSRDFVESQERRKGRSSHEKDARKGGDKYVKSRDRVEELLQEKKMETQDQRSGLKSKHAHDELDDIKDNDARCRIKMGTHRNQTRCAHEDAEAFSCRHSNLMVGDVEITKHRKAGETGGSYNKNTASAKDDFSIPDVAPTDVSEDLRAKVRAMLRQIA